ncbi:MAG TPA: substrate-binding domain-containing protein [Solirubrobacteraceae bacterium]|jgi:ribose transport system substrate-binding protein|nr:substrate-binding domain-containing protein [Solirubrobacteraceae bacterium]
MTHHDRRRGGRLRTRGFTAIIGTLVLALALAACGSSSSSSSTASSSAPASSGSSSTSSSGSASTSAAATALAQYKTLPTTINITTPLKSAPPKGKTIVMLGTNNPSNVIVQQGLAKLAKMAGWNYSLVTYDPANPGTFTQAETTALAKHPQYLVEAGLPLTASQLAMAKSAGAKWILDSVYPVSVTDPVIGQVDAYAQDALMGKITADYFVSDSGGKGTAVIEHVPSYPILDGFTTGFSNEVKAQCPSCKTSTTNITIPDLVAGKAASELVSSLRSNSSANYLVFDDGPFADGITSALSAAGLNGKVKVIGEAADTAGIAALKNGSEAAWTGFDPGYQAYEDMDIAFRNAEGMPVPVALEAQQPTQLLTKDTIGSTTNWSAPTDAQAQFMKLWQLG